jgi:hypothetical protein
MRASICDCLQFCSISLTDKAISGLYYKTFTIVIYDRNAIGQYYKTKIVGYDRSEALTIVSYP